MNRANRQKLMSRFARDFPPCFEVGEVVLDDGTCDPWTPYVFLCCGAEAWTIADRTEALHADGTWVEAGDGAGWEERLSCAIGDSIRKRTSDYARERTSPAEETSGG